jgi:hypothetical protein
MLSHLWLYLCFRMTAVAMLPVRSAILTPCSFSRRVSRKAHFTAPSHLKRKIMSASLTKELRAEHGVSMRSGGDGTARRCDGIQSSRAHTGARLRRERPQRQLSAVSGKGSAAGERRRRAARAGSAEEAVTRQGRRRAAQSAGRGLARSLGSSPSGSGPGAVRLRRCPGRLAGSASPSCRSEGRLVRRSRSHGWHVAASQSVRQGRAHLGTTRQHRPRAIASRYAGVAPRARAADVGLAHAQG